MHRSLAVLTLLFWLVACSGAFASQHQPMRPNVLLILADDLGKEWIPLYGGEDVGMPNLERLARDGTVFDNVYVMPQCTPTRVSLLTGQYPFRHGWINHWDTPRWGHAYFDWRHHVTIARLMRQAGYATAAAGKWQVNDFRLTPDAMNEHGFDEYLMWTGYETGVPASAERYWAPYLHSVDGSRTYPGAFSEDLFTDFLAGFIDANKERPWFAYYPMVLPHVPLTTTPAEPDAETDMDQFGAMLRYTDHLLGRLLSHLEEFGEDKETVVVWMTDNGSDRRFTGMRHGVAVKGGKARTDESGVNVPFIVSGPNTPAGVRNEALVDVTDLFPTLAELAGIDVPQDIVIDGYSFAGLLDGSSTVSERAWMMAMGGHNNAAVCERGVQNQFHYRDRVIRDARYKLYVAGSPARGPQKLFDLIVDPHETIDLVASDDPSVRVALDRFDAIVAGFPKQDADPMYHKRAANAWDVDVSVECGAWKQLLDLAGLPQQAGVDGASLKPLLEDPSGPWDRPVVMTFGYKNHAVQTDRWRYIEYHDGTSELYDHTTDPHEWTNLSPNPDYANVIRELRRSLPTINRK